MSRKVVLVTGASAGLGASIATEMAGRDWDVLAASRRGLAPAGGSVRPVVMDVTSVESVRKSIGSERLDAIVCNAGINAAAPAEELDDARARSILETNFWGVVNTVRAALPKFRQQGQGCIVVIGSLAGLVAPPGASYYAASKHALEGWLESLQYEVAGFGVRVHLIEPGFIRTDLAAAEPVPASLPEYDGLRERLQRHWQDSIHDGMPPETVARRVVDLMEAGTGPFRLRLGTDAVWVPRWKQLLPEWIFFRIAGWRFGLNARG